MDMYYLSANKVETIYINMYLKTQYIPDYSKYHYMNAVCFIQRNDTIRDNNSKTSLGHILCDKAEVDSFMSMQYISFHYTLKGWQDD